MNASTDLPRITLDRLHLSPLNARKTAHNNNIAGLAASISAHGLLQNLTVTVNAAHGHYEVVAGGRRLAAMQLLQQEGRLPATLANDGVPCLVITDGDVAHEASTAENTLREAMHPADQFDAFKRMVDAKKPIADIAAHFGVGEIVVKQRLKLANVAPKLVKLYRESGMDLDQLQALALTDDHKLQEKVWFGAKNDWNRTARDIRHAITNTEVRSDSLLARFVGLDAYEAAGGQVRRDLFSTRNEAFLGDKALLDKLALDKLEAIAKAERDAGWSWAEAHLSLDYEKLAAFPHFGVRPKRQKATAEDKTRISKLETRLVEINKIIAQEDENDLPDSDACESLEDESNDIHTELHALREGREVWPAEIMGKAGVVVCIGYSGGLQVARGRLKPGQKASASGAVTGSAKDNKKDPPKKAALSQDMVHRLELHRAAAIREHIANDPAAALQLLLAHLLTKLLTDSYAESLFDINPKNVHKLTKSDIDSKFADVGKSTARKALDDRLAGWKKDGMPGKSSDIYTWLGTITEDKRLQLLALATALTMNTNNGSRGHALAEQFGVDMTKWWTATPETFIGVVQKALLAEAVADVAGKTDGEAVLSLKKEGAMAEAAKKLAGTGWLPKPLRGSAYKAVKPGTAKAVAKIPMTPKTAKKATKTAKKTTKKAIKPALKKATKK